MDGPNSESSKKCSWCGTLNSADAPSCSKCSAALSALQPLISASPSSTASPTLDQENQAPYQDVIAPLVDSSLFDRMSGEAMRSLGLGPSFEPGRTLAFFVIGGLSLYILLSLVGLVADYSRIQTLSKATGRLGVLRPGAMEIDAQTLLIRFALFIVVLLTAVSFLAWIYRAHKNLRALGATDLKYSPGWAIGGFFIPFLNIVRPYQVVSEIWRASAGEMRWSGGGAWIYAQTPVFIAVWWGSWLTLGILDSLGAFTLFGALGADQLLVATRYRIFYYIVGVASAALAITVVQKTNARQESAHRLIWSKTLRDEGPGSPETLAVPQPPS
jgi:hypothetical protein